MTEKINMDYLFRMAAVLCVVVTAASVSTAQAGPGRDHLLDKAPENGPVLTDRPAGDDGKPAHLGALPFWVEPTRPMESTLYADGSVIEVETERIWRPMCGSDPEGMTIEDLQAVAARVRERFADESNLTILHGNAPRVGPNVIYTTDSSVPSAAVPALNDVADYIESVFTDNISIFVDVSFGTFGGNVIGSASSSYSVASYSTARNGLTNGMDADDVIQDWLPTGSTIDIRYDGNSSSTTGENRVFFTTANYKATIGSVGGTDSSLTFNDATNWDYDPSNGVSGIDFQGVLVHEITHAMGFTSAADSGAFDIDALDLYRFQRTDGSGDYNPDSLAEFQSTPRTVDFDTPNDDANSDIIDVEYRMADGSPFQASHFRNASPSIYIMDPQVFGSETFYPDFYQAGDLDMLDAIGWDYADAVCFGDGECDDSNACTVDTCESGQCVNTSINCGDGNACTNDSCDPVLGCQYEAVNCDDNSVCTTDSCDTVFGCQYVSIVCDDDEPCTTDTCDPVNGCEFTPFACNTGACCHGNGSCTYGTEMDCTGFVCDIQELVSTNCFADVDGSGVVNASDRAFISANIAVTNPIFICIYDLDGSGVINASDRGIVSANIGLCGPIPDWQNGSGLNHGQPDSRFSDSVFQGFAVNCEDVTCP